MHIELRHFGDAAVQHDIGNSGLFLDLVGEFTVLRFQVADIDDEIGMQRLHLGRTEIAFLAGEAAGHGQGAIGLGYERLLTIGERAHPADHLLRRYGIDRHCGGRPGGQHTRDRIGQRDRAAEGIVNSAALAGANQPMTASAASARNITLRMGLSASPARYAAGNISWRGAERQGRRLRSLSY